MSLPAAGMDMNINRDHMSAASSQFKTIASVRVSALGV